jgi:hypothetical protein
VFTCNTPDERNVWYLYPPEIVTSPPDASINTPGSADARRTPYKKKDDPDRKLEPNTGRSRRLVTGAVLDHSPAVTFMYTVVALVSLTPVAETALLDEPA